MCPRKSRHFNYEALQDPTKDFRLLRFERCRDLRRDTTLQFHLFHTPISTDEPYFALSYEWGKSDATARILVNQSEFIIQRNLHCFLQQTYRHKVNELPINIWVDSICINQGSDDGFNEKNHQINTMHQIYSNARSVFAWLGEEDHSTVLAARFLAKCHRDLSTLPNPHDTRSDRERRDNFTRLVEPSKQIGSNISLVLESLKNLCGRTYWSRLWVVQEVLLSRAVEVVCGSHWFSEAQMHIANVVIHTSWMEADHLKRLLAGSDAGTWLADAKPTEKGCGDERNALYDVFWRPTFEFRRLGQGIEGCTSWPNRSAVHELVDCLERYSEWNCVNLHDKVYGFLGLASDARGRRLIEVNYTMPLVGLLAQVLPCCTPGRVLSLGEKLIKRFGLLPEDEQDSTHWAQKFVSTWTAIEPGLLEVRMSIMVWIAKLSDDVVTDTRTPGLIEPKYAIILDSTGWSVIFCTQLKKADYVGYIPGTRMNMRLMLLRYGNRWHVSGIAFFHLDKPTILDYASIFASLDLLEEAYFSPDPEWSDLPKSDPRNQEPQRGLDGEVEICVRDCMALITFNRRVPANGIEAQKARLKDLETKSWPFATPSDLLKTRTK